MIIQNKEITEAEIELIKSAAIQSAYRNFISSISYLGHDGNSYYMIHYNKMICKYVISSIKYDFTLEKKFGLMDCYDNTFIESVKHDWSYTSITIFNNIKKFINREDIKLKIDTILMLG